MLLEEYDCTLEHIQGKDNIIADGLSCLDADYDSKIEYPIIRQDEQGVFSIYCMPNMEALDREEYSLSNQTKYELAENYIYENKILDTDFPLYPPLILEEQDKDLQ